MWIFRASPVSIILAATVPVVTRVHSLHVSAQPKQATSQLLALRLQDIPLDWIQHIFPRHTVYQVFLEPADVGHGGLARMRSFMYIAHKTRAVYLHDLYEVLQAIVGAIVKTVQTEPRDYMVAGPTTRALDTQLWCRSRNIVHQAVP